MALIQINDLSFTYAGEKEKALSGLSLSIKEGEFVLLCGPSGCGKTTLLRQLKREITPAGSVSGTIFYDGRWLANHPPAKTAREIGIILQNPESQIVMDTVWHELAFGMENLGYPMDLMRRRVAEMAAFFGLEGRLYRSVHELSGGEKQIVSLAAVLALYPRVLLLDEPTAQLDPVAAKEFISLIYRINRELGITILISEHRLDEIFPLADRVIMLEKGSIKYQGSPSSIGEKIFHSGDRIFINYLPILARIYLTLTHDHKFLTEKTMPLTVKETLEWSRSLTLEIGKKSSFIPTSQEHPGIKHERPVLLQAEEIWFSYRQKDVPVLKDLSLKVHSGDFLAVLGTNGTGKSTLLQILTGILKPQRGSVRLAGQNIFCLKENERYHRLGYLAQNPLLHFVCDTVEEELKYVAAQKGLTYPAREIEIVTEYFQIQGIYEKHPYDLSGGELQKAALACLLLARPEILLIDEPTKGLDPAFKKHLGELLSRLNSQGLTIVMATHDVEFAACYASKCLLLFDGIIAAENNPSDFFSENYFYTTMVNRVFRQLLHKAVTEKDVYEAWAGAELSITS